MEWGLAQFIFLARTESRLAEVVDQLWAGEEVPDVPGPSVRLGEGAGDGDGRAGADRQVKQRLRGLGHWSQVASFAHGTVGGALFLKKPFLAAKRSSTRALVLCLSVCPSVVKTEFLIVWSAYDNL